MAVLVLLIIGGCFIVSALVCTWRQHYTASYCANACACVAWAAADAFWGRWYLSFLFTLPLVYIFLSWRRWKAPFGLKVLFLAKRLGRMPPPDRAAMQGRRMAPRRWPL